MACATIDAALSISSFVVCLPSEKRIADDASSVDNPMASKTCDAITDPTMHADPLAAQTPSRSSAIRIVSELRPGKLTLSVFAREGAPLPFRIASGQTAAILFHKSSRKA